MCEFIAFFLICKKIEGYIEREYYINKYYINKSYKIFLLQQYEGSIVSMIASN